MWFTSAHGCADYGAPQYLLCADTLSRPIATSYNTQNLVSVDVSVSTVRITDSFLKVSKKINLVSFSYELRVPELLPQYVTEAINPVLGCH